MTPLVLAGDAHTRGRAQAALAPDSVAPVRALVANRLAQNATLLARPHVRRFLAAQWHHAATHDADGLAELRGIADGYGLDPHDLLAFLHAGQLSGLPDDGCSAWGFRDPELGALLVKSRDLRGPALPLQRVFLHHDPAWGRRRLLCVGSLGAPGAYSSGINSDGLALVDTQVVVPDQGVGLLRYFLMTRLLIRCASVAEALDHIRAVAHAGGGTLLLADATGALAAVELGHRHTAIDRPTGPWVARTNHFLATPPDQTNPDSSHARLATLTAWLAAHSAPPTQAEARALMASHDTQAATGLCRHGGDTLSSTVSCALFATALRTLELAHGSPCTAPWASFGLERSPL